MMKYLLQPFNNLYYNRRLLASIVLSEAKAKNAGSIMGRFWFVLSPLIFVSIYSVVYSFIFKLKPHHFELTEYILYLFAGMLPYLAVSEALVISVNCLRKEKNLLDNATFPIEVLPIKSVVAPVFSLLWAMLILIIYTLLFTQMHISILLLPVAILFHILLLLGIGFFLTIAGVFLPDLSNLIGYISMLLMICSPIAYTPDMVPEKLQFLIWLNPFSYLFQSYQAAFLGDKVGYSSFNILIPLALLIFYFGFFLFMKTRKEISIYA